MLTTGADLLFLPVYNGTSHVFVSICKFVCLIKEIMYLIKILKNLPVELFLIGLTVFKIFKRFLIF